MLSWHAECNWSDVRDVSEECQVRGPNSTE